MINALMPLIGQALSDMTKQILTRLRAVAPQPPKPWPHDQEMLANMKKWVKEGLLHHVDADQLMIQDVKDLQDWVQQHPELQVSFDAQGRLVMPPTIGADTFNAQQVASEIAVFAQIYAQLENALRQPEGGIKEQAVQQAATSLQAKSILLAALADGYRRLIRREAEVSEEDTWRHLLIYALSKVIRQSTATTTDIEMRAVIAAYQGVLDRLKQDYPGDGFVPNADKAKFRESIRAFFIGDEGGPAVINEARSLLKALGVNVGRLSNEEVGERFLSVIDNFPSADEVRVLCRDKEFWERTGCKIDEDFAEPLARQISRLKTLPPPPPSGWSDLQILLMYTMIKSCGADEKCKQSVGGLNEWQSDSTGNVKLMPLFSALDAITVATEKRARELGLAGEDRLPEVDANQFRNQLGSMLAGKQPVFRATQPIVHALLGVAGGLTAVEVAQAFTQRFFDHFPSAKEVEGLCQHDAIWKWAKIPWCGINVETARRLAQTFSRIKGK
jgi:hypothetical protein